MPLLEEGAKMFQRVPGIKCVSASQRRGLRNQIELGGRPCQTRAPGEVDELIYLIPGTLYNVQVNSESRNT